ncbi:MAG TPA: hypothetical protein VKB46_16135 [Pyrinomonadaceae bacterium]|nr:hypothetical protein [Pyrinomonadaceae bacterium]
MRDLIIRWWINIVGRFGGPMTFRIILQPAMAALLAFRGGLRDAREGRPPYFWTMLTDSANRAELLREGWRAIARVFVLAVVMDIIYQFIVERWIYPFETLAIAILLAVVPYLLIRGPVTRIVRRWRGKTVTNGETALKTSTK